MPLLNVLLSIVITLAIIGVALWALNTFAATIIDARILKIINNLVIVVVIIWLLIWLLRIFGLWVPLHDVRVG